MIDLQVLFVPYSSDGTTTNDCTYSQSNLLPFRIHHYQRLLHHLPSYISSRYLNQLQLKSTFPTIGFFCHTTSLQNSSNFFFLGGGGGGGSGEYFCLLFYLPLNGHDFLSFSTTIIMFHSKRYL